jgi:iron complex outermembrane receptor protein
MLLCAVASGGLFAQPATAQSTNQTGAQSPAAEADGAGIADIIVTAQRRSENLQKAALSLTAITGDAIANANVVRADDLSKLAPSLAVSSGGGTRANVYLRGVGNAGNDSYAENAIAFNYDGVYVSSPGGVNGLFYDLQRVEVLKGPQGTLYGRNATGGAINVIPNAPDYRLSGGASVSFGNYNALQTGGFLNVPLVDGKLALRAAFQTSQHDGYYNDGAGDDNVKSARVVLLWEPSADFKIKIGADYSERSGRGQGAHLASLVAPDTANVWDGLQSPSAVALLDFFHLPPLGQSPFTGTSFVNKADNKFVGVNATLSWQTGIGTLTVIPAYRHARLNFIDFSPTFIQAVNEREHQYSLEARLASDESHALRYVFGLFGFRETIETEAELNQVISQTLPSYRVNNKSGAAFGQLTYAITPAFRLTAGMRYTAEKKAQTTSAKFGIIPGNPPTVIPPAAQVPVSLAGSATFNNVTYKVGGEWDVGPSNLLYANFATGFKAGGFFSATTDNSYQPEKLDAFTIGSKNRFFDNKLQINIEAFYWKYKGQQFSHLELRPNGELTYATENVGQSTIKGVDLDVQYAPTRDTRLSLLAQYNDAKYTQFGYSAASPTGAAALAIRTGCPFTPTGPITFQVDCTGKRLAFAPELTLTASASQTFRFTNGAMLVAEARTSLQTKHFVSFDFLSSLEQKSATNSSFNLTYSSANDRYKISAFVDNIENNAVKVGGVVNPFFPIYSAYLKPPRTAGVRVSFQFGN